MHGKAATEKSAKAPSSKAAPLGKAAHLALGARGEELAVAFLKKRKLAILERNWRPSGGAASLSAGLRGLELDIVAREGDTLVFVEVKTRSASASGPGPGPGQGGEAPFNPLSVYSAAKRARLQKAVSLYLSEKQAWELPCRVDLVCVEVDEALRESRVNLYQNVLGGGEIF